MKTLTKKVIVLVFVALFMFVSCSMLFSAPLSKVEAGASKSHVLSKVSLSGDTLNLGDIMMDGGVYAKSNKIRFDKNEVSSQSYIIATNKINNLGFCGVKQLFTFKGNINISEFDKIGGSISLIFGMNGLRSVDDPKDCLVIKFEKNGENNKINVSVTEIFDEDKKEDFSVLPTGCMEFVKYDEDLTVFVDTKSNGETTIKINNMTLIKNYKSEVDQTGYFAVFSDGINDFSLSKLEMIAHNYITETNMDYKEEFNNNEYNANLFYSASKAMDYAPSSLEVKDGALQFNNCYNGYFSTTMKYSNFELKFDLFDFITANVVDEEGNIIKPMTGRIGLGIGDEYKGELHMFEKFDTWLLMWGDRDNPLMELLERFNKRGDLVFMEEFPLWDSKFVDGRKVNVRFSSIDGVIKLDLKFDGSYDVSPEDENYDEEQLKYYDYKTYFEYDLGKATCGYVKIFSYGYSNFKIDNFEIKNMDFVSVKQSYTQEEKPFISNKTEKTPDFDYQTKPDESDLLINKINSKQNNQEGLKASLCSGGAGLILLVISGYLITRRNKK